MLQYIVRRIVLVIPVALGVTMLCFLLVHAAPGDPLTAVLPADATAEQTEQLRKEYGFDRPLPVQYALWIWRVLHGDLGSSVATGRSVASEVRAAVMNTLIIATLASIVGCAFGCLFGFVAAYFKNSLVDRAASIIAVLGVSVPHFWLGMVLVIIFSVTLGWLPATGAGPGTSWQISDLKYAILPALTMSVVPLGVIARTVRALVGDILSQDFIVALQAKGMRQFTIFRHVAKNALPTALAVMGLQLGYLLGGSILIETVFSWPGAGYLLNTAIFQRDLPLLQGTILVLAMFFVFLNVAVDVLQMLIDPRIKRG